MQKKVRQREYTAMKADLNDSIWKAEDFQIFCLVIRHYSTVGGFVLNRGFLVQTCCSFCFLIHHSLFVVQGRDSFHRNALLTNEVCLCVVLILPNQMAYFLAAKMIKRW